MDVHASRNRENRSRKNRMRKVWRNIVSVLACVVVFVTTYALILPAITVEAEPGELICTMPEHQHSEACYGLGQTKTFACSVAPHVHEETCFNENGETLCGRCDYLIHTHDAACYDAEGNLCCLLPERSLAEGEVLHSHSESCYDENGLLICGRSELLEHSHSDECFLTTESSQQVLICGMEEHQHDPQLCYSSAREDVETPEDWEQTLPQQLTEHWPTDVLAVAQKQLGYKESGTNVIFDDAGLVWGYSRYGQWYGDPYARWDAMFASFCLHYGGAAEPHFPHCGDTEQWPSVLAEAELYRSVDEYSPVVGDLIFLNTDSDELADRVVLFTELLTDENGLTSYSVIGGDIDGQVSCVQYPTDDPAILGFGSLHTAYENSLLQKVKVYQDETVTVTATYGPDAGIPAEAELVVKGISPDEMEEYQSYFDEAAATIEAQQGQTTSTTITDFRLYDIYFIYEDQEIQPMTAVDVQISLQAEPLSETAEVSVIHYAVEGAELPKEQEYTVDETGLLSTSFETESFSLFAVVTSETKTSYIVALTQHSLTSSNFSGISGNTYAIVSGTYALSVDAYGNLCTSLLATNANDALTGYESDIRWTFERSSSNVYYIRTTIGETDYYLTASNGALSLTETATTTFTATRSGTNLTLYGGGRYLNLGSSGASLGSSSALSLYTANAGSYTVTFDGQVGNGTYFDGNGNKKYGDSEKFTKTTDSEGYVTLPTGDEIATPGNYPMKLNGWYDIINRIYYDSSMLGEAVKVSGATTFYAEWIPETYDIGQNVDVVENQPDTSNFITTEVFDYTEVFNLHSANYVDGTWTFDPDSELGFIFFDYITSGTIGNISNKNVSVDGITVNAEKTASTRGAEVIFPGTITDGILSGEVGEKRREALFGDDPFPGRINVGEGDWLYSYDPETGYYYYNSAANAATYNQSEQRFYVYDYTVNITNPYKTSNYTASTHDFLPFNYAAADRNYNEKDNEANYWFGMKSEITFYLPDDTGTGGNKAANGETDMQLRFSGDDDVWIFIDGELALDLGGVHDVVYGEINFSTGKVTTGQATSSSNVADNVADSFSNMPGVTLGGTGVTTTDLPTIAGGQNHTITIYYLERGSSLSNCAVYFNLAPAYTLELTKSDADTGERLDGAVFQIFDDAACTIPSDLWITNEYGELESVTGATFTTDDNGVVTCWGLLSGRDYYIKEITPPPVGYPAMDSYVIRINLAEPEESVVLAVDSNGKEWVFASEFVFTEDGTHRIMLDVFNSKYVGDDKSLYVEKVWAEGSENIPDEITIRLYANGEDTGRTLSLNSGNNWRGLFYHLPAADENGVEYVYTVKEEGIPYGYAVQYEVIQSGSYSEEIEVPGYWTTVGSLTAGKTYRFTNGTKALQGSNSTTLTAATSDESNEAQQWIAIASDGKFLLQNKAYPTRYLSITSDGAGLSTSTTANSVELSFSSGRLSARSTLRTYYLRISGSSCDSTRYSSYATTITANEWVPPTTEIITTEIESDGYRVTNTPWTETMSIPVEKVWDDSLGEIPRQDLTIDLYLVTEGSSTTAEKLAELILSESNGWKGSFDDLSYPPEGSYYCIYERTEGYNTSYNTEVTSLFVDNALRSLAIVQIGSDGNPVGVQITNGALVLLPETGGSGTLLYAAGGTALTVLSAFFLLYSHRKRRKEDYSSS